MKFLFLVFLHLISLSIFAQYPNRKAMMGMLGKPVNGGIGVDSILPGSTFEKLGIKKADVINLINNDSVNSTEAYSKIVSPYRSGDELTVRFTRNGKQQTIKGKAIARPFEKNDLADVEYDWVKFGDGYLRTITRKPKGKTNVPAILLIPGYGCGSIENYMGSYNGRLINEWLKAGYGVVTIEKSGLGDSYGCAPCTEVDLVTDIRSFDAGYRYMEQLSYVDKSRLYIWGHSMGGVIAPEVAKLHQPKGVIVFGATFRPWVEFLPEMHRIQKPLLEAQTYEQTEEFMRKITKVYYEFFVQQRSPEELYRNPEYKDIVASELSYKAGSNDMWGRHWRYWQQLDSLNLSKTWQSISCPVLIVHGESDYEQCSRVEPSPMQNCVNAAHPGNASVVYIPQLDHFMMKSKNWEEARDNFRKQQYAKGNFNEALATETIRWLQEH